MTAAAMMMVGDVRPVSFRLPVKVDGLFRSALVALTGAATVSWMALTIGAVGTVGETLSALHVSSYDTSLVPRPLAPTLPVETRYDRLSLIPVSEVGPQVLSADAILTSRDKVATTALADSMRGPVVTWLGQAKAGLKAVALAAADKQLAHDEAAERVVDLERHHQVYVGKYLGWVPTGALASATPDVAPIPVARPYIARPAAPKPEVQVAAVPKVAAPAAQAVAPGRKDKPAAVAAPQVANPPAQIVGLPGRGSRTAVYEMATGTVYMPNGDKLEAHSGIGSMRDNAKYANVQMRGPTPPGTYKLSFREALFHGVQALRMTPVGKANLFGRTGFLTHSYLLRMPGDSHGCVVFRNYDKFLGAFKRGEVTQLIVVDKLSRQSSQRVAWLW